MMGEAMVYANEHGEGKGGKKSRSFMGGIGLIYIPRSGGSRGRKRTGAEWQEHREAGQNLRVQTGEPGYGDAVRPEGGGSQPASRARSGAV